MSSIYIKNAYIVTANGKGEIIKDGSIFIEDGEIKEVGKSDSMKAYRPEYLIDAAHKVVMPGLINTHVHLAQALMRGLVPDNVNLIEWLRDWVWPLQGNMTEDEAAVSTELTLLEMINSGTTTFLATSVNGRYGVNRTIDAVYKSGIRGAIGRQIMDIPGYADQPQMLHSGLIEDADKSLKEFEYVYGRWNNKDGRIWIWLSPRTPGAVSDDLFRRISLVVSEHNSGVTMHLAEVRDDIRYFGSRNTSPARFLKDLGMVGPKHVYVHGVWLNEEDMGIFAGTGTSVSHNPSSNSKLGSGIAKVVSMLRNGVNVTLGTDGGPSNDTYDLLRELRLALLLQKVDNLDPQAFNLMEAIKLATINGARGLGIEAMVGSIEVGKRADLAIFDVRKPYTSPSVIAPISNLVYAGTGSDATDVIVDGKFLKKNGKVLVLDESLVIEKAERASAELLARAGKKDWTSPEPL